MMKVVAVLVVLCGISAGYSVPMRNGACYLTQRTFMRIYKDWWLKCSRSDTNCVISQLAAFMYYQQPMGYMGQRQAMYGLHYQNQQLRNQRRSAGVSAFAAGNNLAAGSYLKGKCSGNASSLAWCMTFDVINHQIATTQMLKVPRPLSRTRLLLTRTLLSSTQSKTYPSRMSQLLTNSRQRSLLLMSQLLLQLSQPWSQKRRRRRLLFSLTLPKRKSRMLRSLVVEVAALLLPMPTSQSTSEAPMEAPSPLPTRTAPAREDRPPALPLPTEVQLPLSWEGLLLPSYGRNLPSCVLVIRFLVKYWASSSVVPSDKTFLFIKCNSTPP